jgi:hypothetical protein
MCRFIFSVQFDEDEIIVGATSQLPVIESRRCLTEEALAMRTFLRVGTLCLAMTLLSATVALADDLWNGTWVLDPSACTYNPGKVRKSDTRIYTVTGNKIHLSGDVESADGKKLHIDFDAAYDGKDYSVNGNPKVQTIAIERIDEYRSKATTKRDGKITAVGNRVISKDGDTMTITSSGTDEDGVPYSDVLVFHRAR